MTLPNYCLWLIALAFVPVSNAQSWVKQLWLNWISIDG
jgi:hypothetical protein